MARQGRPILPFYLVLDVSYSMVNDMDTVNAAMGKIGLKIAGNSILSDKTRMAIVEFSDNAAVVVPLCDLEQLKTLPVLSAQSGTHYGNAFTLLRSTIESDVRQLMNDDFQVYRPAVFFVSDGEPLDDGWRLAFGDLTSYDKKAAVGFKWYPKVVAFGIREAGKDTMRELVHPPGLSRGFFQAEGATVEAAFDTIVEIILGSLLSSGTADDGEINWDDVDHGDMQATDGTSDFGAGSSDDGAENVFLSD